MSVSASVTVLCTVLMSLAAASSVIDLTRDGAHHESHDALMAVEAACDAFEGQLIGAEAAMTPDAALQVASQRERMSAEVARLCAPVHEAHDAASKEAYELRERLKGAQAATHSAVPQKSIDAMQRVVEQVAADLEGVERVWARTATTLQICNILRSKLDGWLMRLTSLQAATAPTPTNGEL